MHFNLFNDPFASVSFSDDIGSVAAVAAATADVDVDDADALMLNMLQYSNSAELWASAVMMWTWPEYQYDMPL